MLHMGPAAYLRSVCPRSIKFSLPQLGMRLLCFSFDQLCYSPMLQIMSDYALAISRLFSNYALDIARLRSKALLLYASGRCINLQSESCGDFSWSSTESTDHAELEPEVVLARPLESRLHVYFR